IESNEILEENHYYPFGMKHERYNEDTSVLANRFRFNSREYQDEFGLNVTAMDFRQYDNAIGRFHNIDAMTDIMPSLTPYRFAFNNPVIWKDPTGLLEEGDDTPHIALEEVVVSTKARTSEYASMPASFSYHLLDGKNINRNYRGTLDDYNRQFG